jgi:hypothetical protein
VFVNLRSNLIIPRPAHVLRTQSLGASLISFDPLTERTWYQPRGWYLQRRLREGLGRGIPQPLFWFQSFQLTLYPFALSGIIPILSGLTPIGTHSDFR